MLTSPPGETLLRREKAAAEGGLARGRTDLLSAVARQRRGFITKATKITKAFPMAEASLVSLVRFVVDRQRLRRAGARPA